VLLTHQIPGPLAANAETVTRVLTSGSWQPVGESRRKSNRDEAVTASPDGRLNLQWTFQKAQMSSLSDPGSVLWTIDNFRARNAVFSPDSKFLAVTSHEEGNDVARLLDDTEAVTVNARIARKRWLRLSANIRNSSRHAKALL